MPGFEESPELCSAEKLLRQPEKSAAAVVKLGLETAAQVYFAACRTAAASFTALPKMRKQRSHRQKY